MTEIVRNLPRDILTALRLSVLLVAMMLGIMVLMACNAIAHAATPTPATLKGDATLTGATITAADLFDGLDKETAGKVLGPAPQPGKDLTLNTLALMQVAAALNVDWKPQSTTDQITIRSASTLVTSDAITDALTKKLQEKGVTGDFKIALSDAPKLILPKDQPGTVEVASIAYHPESDRFEATLAGPNAAHPATTAQVTGHVDRVVNVPMLKKPVRQGDVIGAQDVEWKELPASSVQQDAVIDADQLIGKTPRRMVMAEQMVRAGDLGDPLLVNRGASVTIVYAKGPITVTAKGTAMDNGAKGNVIHVVNNASSKSIDATVSDSGTVTVVD